MKGWLELSLTQQAGHLRKKRRGGISENVSFNILPSLLQIFRRDVSKAAAKIVRWVVKLAIDGRAPLAALNVIEKRLA